MAEQRVALVTGASGGIGRAIALRLAAAGLQVAVAARTDDRYPATIEETVDAIRALGGRAVPYECDLSLREDRLGLVPRVQADLGAVDVLVNNAAVSTMEAIETFPERRVTLMFNVQVRTALELSQAVIPGMRERGRGWIINITSAAARHPHPPASGVGVQASRNTVYGMCKAAIERLSTGLAAELYDDGINVNALAPTHIVPTFGAKAFFDLSERTTEPPEDMADAIHHLVSPAAARITGQILYSQDVLQQAHGQEPAAAEDVRP
jgi:citronellol/citronellal dehydrogenase